MTRRRVAVTLAVGVFVWPTLAVTAGMSAYAAGIGDGVIFGQAQPPGGQPPGGQPPGGAQATQLPGGPPDSAAVADATRRGAVAIVRKAAFLEKLGAFPSPVPEGLRLLIAQLQPAPSGDRASLIRALGQVDAEGHQALDQLAAGGVVPAKDLQVALAPLSEADRAALVEGSAISVSPESYESALRLMIEWNGRPLAEATPAPSAETFAAAYAAFTAPLSQGGSPSPAAPATVPQSSEDTGASGPPVAAIAIGIGALAVFIAVIAVIVSRRSGRRGPDSALSGKGESEVGILLDVSRRLAALTSAAEIEERLVSEAARLLSGDGGAIIRRRGDSLSIGFENPEGLLVPEHLDEGVVRRSADTGQSVVQSSSTEAVVRHVPVSLAVVPIVGDGQVQSVVLLARDVDRPFSAAERETLESLAPVAAAALASAHQTESITEESLSDPLTGVGNRRRLDIELPQLIDEAGDGPISVAMIDLDRFKLVNDSLGHPAGDALLRAIAQIVQSSVRPGDRVYRYGGEEFCVILPDATPEDAAEAAERILSSIRETEFDLGTGEPARATASIGVASSEGGMEGMIDRADAALYAAKEGGRDRVDVSPETATAE